MRVFVDALSARTGGGISYLRGLLAGLARVDDRHEWLVGVREGFEGDFATASANQHVLAYKTPARGPAFRFLWEQADLPGVLRSLGADLVFLPSSYGLLRPPVPEVVAVQAPFPVRRYARGIYPRLRWRVRALMLRATAKRAAALVTVSEDLRREVHETFHVPLDRLTAVPLGVDERFRPPPDAEAARRAVEARFGASGPYLLSVSDVYVHKNLPALVRAFARALPRLGDRTLLIAGKPWDRRESARVTEAIASFGLGGRVRLLGPAAREDLPALYATADALVFPSTHETFGLPPLEAMACGTPVAASNASSVPEVCGDAALLFDPADDAAIAEALVAVATDDALRADLVRKGFAQAKRFTWDVCARAHLAVFEHAAG